MRNYWKLLPAAVIALILLGRQVLVLPLSPDRPELSAFAPQPQPPRPPVELSVTALKMGSSRVPRCGPAGEATCMRTTEIVHGAYLVKHPKGTFLIDSGFSHGGAKDLERFAFLDRQFVKFTQTDDLASALMAQGSPKIDFVLLTHAHWDHTSGLKDLPAPQVFLGPGEEAFARAWPKDSFPAVMADHLQGARVSTVSLKDGPYENFPASLDWFGDGSVVVVPLSGHTPGSLGIFLNRVHGKRLLFIGDTAWSLRGVELPSHKLRLMSAKVDHDTSQVSDQLLRLHHLHVKEPDLLIVPAHDGTAMSAVSAL